ncbi:MAG: Uma2 family endonuclease [Pseudomonadota bacterium]
MNAPAPLDEFGYRKWTVTDIRALIDQGLMDHQDPYELIDGVLYEMPSEGFDHVDLKNLLAEWLIKHPQLRGLRVIVDSTLYLSETNAPDPDIYVYPRDIPLRELKGSDVRLVVEVANSSLRKDQVLKAPLYERFGVQEYWILDLETRTFEVRRLSSDGTYGEAETVSADGRIACGSIEGLNFSLADLTPEG